MNESLDAVKRLAEEHEKNRMVCANCGWFAARDGEQIGECHRYPPSHATLADEEWKHARTSRENVCGEFVHRKTGDSFQADPYRALIVRLNRAEEELNRMQREVAK